MKRKFLSINELITNQYKARLTQLANFADPGVTDKGGFDLSTKEGVLAFLTKNKQMVLEMKEWKDMEAQATELEAKNAALEAKLAKAITAESPEFKALQEEAKQFGLSIKALKDGSKNGIKYKKGSIAEFLQANDAKIKKLMTEKGSTLALEYKAFEDATAIGSGDPTNSIGRDAYFTWHEGGAVGQIPVRRPFMRELFNDITVGTEWIKYIDQATITRNASNVAYCGTTTSNTQVTFKVFTLQIQKIRDFMDVCLDMLSDYGFVQGEINRLLNQSLDLKIDNDLLLGTGVAPILNGLAKYASTFAANNADPSLNYAASTPNAQLIDLISICGAQIRQLGQQNMFYPNAVLLNPRDVQGIKALKNSFGDYIRDSQLINTLFVDTNGRYYIDGMMLVENPLVAANTLYIGDFTKGTVYSMPGIGIEFSYENRQNFETETVTIKIYERLNLLIRSVDANAFMFVSDIGAGITAITKAPLVP